MGVQNFGTLSRLLLVLRQFSQLLLQSLKFCYRPFISPTQTVLCLPASLLTTFPPLDLIFLQLHPGPVCQLVCERRHKQDFSYWPREGFVESNLPSRSNQHLSRGSKPQAPYMRRNRLLSSFCRIESPSLQLSHSLRSSPKTSYRSHIFFNSVQFDCRVISGEKQKKRLRRLGEETIFSKPMNSHPKP